jgi:hypothetical protein
MHLCMKNFQNIHLKYAYEKFVPSIKIDFALF